MAAGGAGGRAADMRAEAHRGTATESGSGRERGPGLREDFLLRTGAAESDQPYPAESPPT